MTINKAQIRQYQMLVFISLNQFSPMANCTQHCQEEFLVRALGFWPTQIRMLTPLERAQKILSSEMYQRCDTSTFNNFQNDICEYSLEFHCYYYYCFMTKIFFDKHLRAARACRTCISTIHIYKTSLYAYLKFTL